MTEERDNNEQEYFYIPNENGEEEEFEILCEFANPETDYHYVLLVPTKHPDGEEVEVYPIRYKLTGEEPVYEVVETEDEWNMIEEVLDTLGEDEDEDQDET